MGARSSFVLLRGLSSTLRELPLRSMPISCCLPFGEDFTVPSSTILLAVEGCLPSALGARVRYFIGPDSTLRFPGPTDG